MNTSQFSLTNFYIFLIEFGFSILFLVIFSSIHYGITRRTKLGIKITESRVINFWYFFCFGLILSLLTFIFSQVSSLALDDIGMPITILGLIYAMTVFYNRSVQAGAILPTLAWVLYQYNGFTEYNFAWLMRIVAVLILALISVGTTFIKWKDWPKFLVSVFTSGIILIILVITLVDNSTGYYCATIGVATLTTIFFYAVIKYINKVFAHMSKMANQGAYVYHDYLIPTVLNEYFHEFVKENNISQALVISFDIKLPEKQKVELLHKIKHLFDEDKALLFQSKFGTYGLVLTGERYYVQNLNQCFVGNKLQTRQDNDPLKYLSMKLETLQTQLVAYTSIYGVHSCNIDDLLHSNDYAFRKVILDNPHNIVQLFNTNTISQEKLDEINYSTLTQKIDLNDINVELELIEMKKSKFIYVCPRFYWPKKLTCNIQTIMRQFDSAVASALLRSLAMKSLELYVKHKELQKYKILIYYPIDQLNQPTWSIANIINKIYLLGINPKKVILSFNSKNIKYWPKQILSNLRDIEKHNIEYFLVDVVNVTGIKNLHPSGIIVDMSLNAKLSAKAKQYKLNIL